MKNILFVLFLIFPFFGFVSDTNSTTGDQFRRDYNNVAIHTFETNTWSEWIRADHTFIFNYNSRSDVLHMKANGENFVYKRVTDIKETKNNENQKFQTFYAIDEEGIRFKFNLFEDSEVGVMMIYSDVKIQFSRF